ncbi:MAG: 50S ribosomal protein L29 [Candidatus Abawacabacteria bacterium]|nr:50S ribosomal protein L29 [Candidatus Abawacabacteria bacterium]
MYTLAELRNLSVVELNKELLKAKQEKFRVSLAVRTGAEKNTSLVDKARKYIASVETVLNSPSKV